SLPPDLIVDPKVALFAPLTYAGHVVLYTANVDAALDSRSERFACIACPQFELQPGQPPEHCLSIKHPRRNRNKRELLDARRSSLKVGALVDANTQYLWSLAFLLEGVDEVNESMIN
ncbi:MAG: hypothetical protein ACKPKO_48710, partial [Candidatus Fonsibacter sp.]